MYAVHDQYLPIIAGIGKDLLVTRHPGIEADLTGGSASFAKGLAIVNDTIFKQQDRGSGRSVKRHVGWKILQNYKLSNKRADFLSSPASPISITVERQLFFGLLFRLLIFRGSTLCSLLCRRGFGAFSGSLLPATCPAGPFPCRLLGFAFTLPVDLIEVDQFDQRSFG